MNKNIAVIIGAIIVIVLLLLCTNKIIEGQQEIKDQIASLKTAPGVTPAVAPARSQPVAEKNEIGFRPSYKCAHG